MKNFRYILAAAALCAAMTISAQEKLGTGWEVDKTVHDFGNILQSDGPVTCTFTFTKTGGSAGVIYNVATTCGCTDVSWTKEPIRSGSKGTVSVTYSNNEGPYPFDKNVTVYVSEMTKPVILKIRGISTAKQMTASEMYPVNYGPLGIKSSYIKCGNIEQGGRRSDVAKVANLSKEPITVEFSDVSEGLSLNVKPNPIPAGGEAELNFTVKALDYLWGRNDYFATPVVNGKVHKNADGDSRIGFWAFTKDDFSDMTKEEKAKGPRPTFKESTYTFGKVKKGTVVQANYTFTNEGKSDLIIHKVDADAKGFRCEDIPVAAPEQTINFKAELDTSSLPAGECLVMITLTTNSPLRPIVIIFLTGYIE